MHCLTLYIFDRQGTCLHYREWYRTKSVKQGAGSEQDDRRQLFGLFWTLSNFSLTLDPKDFNKPKLGAPRRIGQGCCFSAIRTNTYKMHYLESPSGLKFILNTTPDVENCRDVLQTIYEELYLEYVAKNPLYRPGQPFACDEFNATMDTYLRARGLLPRIA